MKTKIVFSLIFMFVFILQGCFKVPISGRRQVRMLPESSLMSMGLTNYKSFLNENPKVPDNDSQTKLVKHVGGRIAKAVESFMKTEGLSKRISGYKWEFNLVNQDVANAWCMPGGKVVVYTGLLPITEDETGLAVVMGHEIAHAIARHGNERMSQQLLLVMGGIGLSVALSDKPKETHDLFLSVYGVSSALGALKYGRTHETEADQLGLTFMAMAGYDPDKAVDFWKRMDAKGGNSLPQFMSTHPSHIKRIQDIEDFLPEARNHYRAALKKK